jgi:lipopolysaccharide export system protein LptA
MWPCAWSRRWPTKEAATHCCSASVLLLSVLVSVALWPACGNAEEARASAKPPAGRGAPATQDPFLGALSFSSSREPVSITAGSLEFDYRGRVLTYTGEVVVTQADMKLQSDRLTVALDEHRENRVKEVIADGQVRLSKGARWATGGHAVFDQTQNTVVLSQNAVLHDGPNEVSGDRVVGYLDEERFVVEGGNGRVKAVLYPSPAESAAAPQGGTP